MVDRSPISYQLAITLTRPMEISIGSLGKHIFPAGQYIYTGSARRNMDARIRRHLNHEKRMHWHIDYLLAAPVASVQAVHQFKHTECELNQHTAGQILIPGFGASDCRHGCGSHLKYLG